MKSLRILVAVPYYYPAIGGVETYSKAIVDKLEKEGHSVIILTTSLAGEHADAIQDDSIIRLRPWIKLSNTPMNPLWYFQIKKVIASVNPDVIHVHSPVPFLADMTVLAAGKRVPVLMTYHAGSMRKGNSSVDTIIGFYERYILPQIFRRVDKIGAVLPRFAQKLIDTSEKVVFTPPGIDTSVYKPNANVNRTTDIIFAGRLESTSDWKGLDILLQAVALVKKKLPNIRVQIVGRGNAVDTYRQLAKDISIQDNVTFITDKNGKQMVSVYQAAKIIVLPSKTEAESFGMVLAEAMACGVAPVGSRIGGIPNVIQHEENGLLVPPNDPKALSRSLLRLLENTEERERLAAKATISIREKFTLQNMTKTNSDLLYEIVKKEVVHVSAYYPPHLGGMEAAISMLANKLHDAGRRVRVVTSNRGVHETPPPAHFPIARLRAFELANTPIMPSLLWRLLRQKPRSIFHVHVAQAAIPEVAFLAAKVRRTPLILHLHGDVEPSGAAGFLLPLYKKVFLGFVLRRAGAVIVPTENYKQTMTRRYALQNPVHVIPSGIDEHFFHTEHKNKTSKPFTVLFVGRLTVEKNVALLIEAISRINHPVQFVVVGDGTLRKSLEKLAKSINLKHSTVVFEGRKSAHELLSYYSKADVFVLASNYESQSLVVLEAMAGGTPVIVADVPAVNEIVGEAGILVEKTAEAFSEAITRLIEDEAIRKRLARKGQLRAKQFDWQTLTHTFEEVYDNIKK